MGRRRKSEEDKKVRISVGLPRRMADWLRSKGNVSAWLERLIGREMEEEKKSGPDS